MNKAGNYVYYVHYDGEEYPDEVYVPHPVHRGDIFFLPNEGMGRPVKKVSIMLKPGQDGYGQYQALDYYYTLLHLGLRTEFK